VDRLPALCHVSRLIDGSIVCRREFPAAAPEHSQGPTISVIAFQESDYNFLREHVTSERVKTHFAEIVHGEVTRYELPLIGALNFVLANALGGGVTRSLALDAHGKGLSSALLDLDLPDRSEQAAD
jgi:hypothetical protein